MILFSADALLMRVRQDQIIRTCMAAPMALDCAGWEIASVDEITMLPSGSTPSMLCELIWCDAEGIEVEKEDASHLAILVASRYATVKDCAFAQQSLRGMLTAILKDVC